MIIDKLIDAIIETENPSIVGLDPRLDMLPGFLVSQAVKKYGNTPKAVAAAFYRFNTEIMDELAGIVPAVKPQVAMYEQYGSDGIECYIKTINYAREKNFIVIGDIKRSDIASTAEAYSDGHLGAVPLGFDESGTLRKGVIYNEDFITVNPYLGFDSIEPYLKNCADFERGMFVLVKTSNKNSGEIQDLDVSGKKVYEIVGSLVELWGKAFVGKHGYSSIGAVVGATHAGQAKSLRGQIPGVFFLVPGYGAQGGKAEDLAACFDSRGLGAIVNSSRGIIAAYKTPRYATDYSEREFALAAKAAALDMKKDLGRFLK